MKPGIGKYHIPRRAFHRLRRIDSSLSSVEEAHFAGAPVTFLVLRAKDLHKQAVQQILALQDDDSEVVLREVCARLDDLEVQAVRLRNTTQLHAGRHVALA